MTRQYLPTGFHVGQVVIATHGKANDRGRVGYSDSATHVWLSPGSSCGCWMPIEHPSAVEPTGPLAHPILCRPRIGRVRCLTRT